MVSLQEWLLHFYRKKTYWNLNPILLNLDKQIPYYWSNKDVKGAVVNQALLSLHGGLLENHANILFKFEWSILFSIQLIKELIRPFIPALEDKYRVKLHVHSPISVGQFIEQKICSTTFIVWLLMRVEKNAKNFFLV